MTIAGDPGDWDFFVDNISFTASGPVLIDPVAAEILSGFQITTDPEALAAADAEVQGVAADGAAQVLVRIPASQAGEDLTVTVINDQGAPSDSPNDDGGLYQVGSPSAPASAIDLTAVDTSQGPMAFAVYRAPRDFARTAADNAATTRSVSLSVTSDDSNSASTTDVLVARPPVVLIHGLWDNSSTWDNFSPLIGDSRFYISRVDYSGAVSGITGSAPSYKSTVLATVKQSALGFGYNAPSVLMQVDNFISDFTFDLNVAAAQADVVVHSMGGDISRTMALSPDFLSADNYGAGPIHKLITIGTPHLGTPLAVQLLADNNACVRNLLAGQGNVALNDVTIDGGAVNGAVGDLQGDGKGGALSAALSSLSASQPFGTAYITGQVNAGNLAGLDCSLPCPAAEIRLVCVTLKFTASPLAQDLSSTGWQSVFGQASDAIVPLTSQGNGISGPINITGVVHSAGTEKLSFKGPAELDSLSTIPTTVIDLLNKKVNDSAFHQ